MKKVLLFLFLLIGFFASAQRIQKNTGYGLAFNRTGADTLFYLPSDTFSVPAYYNNLPFMARKGTSLYLFNTSTKVWDLFSSGGTAYVDTVYNSAGQFTDTIYQTKNGTNTVVKIFDRDDGLVSGGVVAWDSLLVFSVSPAVYYIDGVRYTSPQTYITLDAADGSNPRIDVIGLDATGVIKITGTAAASPAEPQVTPGQIRLTSILVNAGATTPSGVSSTTIYDENTEWTGAATGVTVNFGGTTNVFHLTKTTDVSSFTNGQSFKYTNGADIDISDFTALRFFIRLKATFANNARLQLSWLNGTSVVSNTISLISGEYGFVRTITGSYQTITIPVSDWSFTNSAVDALRITLAGSNGSGFYIDYIQLTGGVSQPQILPNGFGVIQSQSGQAVSGQPNDILTINGSGGISTSATGKTVTISGSYVDTIYRKAGKDSIFYKIAGGLERSIKDSTGGGSTPTLQQVLDAGSTLTSNETITDGGSNFGLTLQRTGGAPTLTLYNSGAGNVIYAETGGSFPFLGKHTNGGAAGFFTTESATTNSPLYPLTVATTTTGTAANGLGTGISLSVETTNGSGQVAGRFVAKLTDATTATFTSQIDIMGADNTAFETFMNIQASGVVRVNNNADTLATKAYARSVGGSGGNVSNTGTPVDNQLAIWTGATTVEGDAELTYDGTTLLISNTSGGDLFKINGTGGTERFKITGASAGAAWLSSNNGDATATIYLTPGSSFSDTRPYWLIQKTAGDPHAFQIRLQKTGSVFETKLDIQVNGAFTINPDGADRDFIVEGDNDANLLTADAGTDRVGIGVASPGAWLDIKAGTTASGQINFTPGVAPSSPNDGDLWYEDTNDRLMFRQNATSIELIGTSSVNAVSPTSPNRTITVVIGGTTYYIHAKTTND